MGTGSAPALTIDDGAEYIYLLDNILQQTGETEPLKDMSSTSNKVSEGNKTEKIE